MRKRLKEQPQKRADVKYRGKFYAGALVYYIEYDVPGKRVRRINAAPAE